MAAGRPTKYKPEYCDMLAQHLTDGLSFDSFGGIIEVSRDTLYNWVKKYPEFSDTKKRYWQSYLLWWEKIGRAGMSGKIKGFSAAMWIYNMKCRFKGDWLTEVNDRDREEVYEVKGIPKVNGDDTPKTE